MKQTCHLSFTKELQGRGLYPLHEVTIVSPEGLKSPPGPRPVRAPWRKAGGSESTGGWASGWAAGGQRQTPRTEA